MIDLGKITQGERGTLTFSWEFPEGLTSPATVMGATITAVAKNLDTGDVTIITGTLTGTAATTVTWALSAGDSGTAGTYALVFRAVVSGTATYTLDAALDVIVNPSATATQNPPLVGVSADEAAWLTVSEAGGALGTAAYEDATDFATATDLTNHINDTTDAHDDSAIAAAASATNYTPAASTVQGHLSGIDTALGVWANWLTELGFGFDYVVDSVNGSDSFDGSTPGQAFATIAKLLTVVGANDTVGLARGSHWRESLALSVANTSIKAYGTGNKPLLDCSDVAANASFTKTGGRTNVYQITVSPDLSAVTWMSAWEDDIRLTRVTTTAACDALPGSYAVSADTGSPPITLYIHASDSSDVIANTKVYEYSKRQAGIITVQPITVDGIHARRNLHEGGSMIFDRAAVVSNCLAEDGNKHNLYHGDGCTFANVECRNAYYNPGNPSKTYFVFNENTPIGLGVNYINCSAVNTGAFDDSASGFYGHKNVSGSFGTATYTGCTVSNMAAGFGGIDAIFQIDDCVTTGVKYAVNVGASTTFNVDNLTAAGVANQPVLFLTTGSILNATNSTFTNTIATSPGMLYLNGAGTFNFTGCTFTCTDAGGYPIFSSTGGNGSTVSMNGCTIRGRWFGWVYYWPHAVTYTGDNNTFAIGQKYYRNATTYNTLADWKAAVTPQDAASVFSAA